MYVIMHFIVNISVAALWQRHRLHTEYEQTTRHDLKRIHVYLHMYGGGIGGLKYNLISTVFSCVVVRCHPPLPMFSSDAKLF